MCERLHLYCVSQKKKNIITRLSMKARIITIFSFKKSYNEDREYVFSRKHKALRCTFQIIVIFLQRILHSVSDLLPRWYPWEPSTHELIKGRKQCLFEFSFKTKSDQALSHTILKDLLSRTQHTYTKKNVKVEARGISGRATLPLLVKMHLIKMNTMSRLNVQRSRTRGYPAVCTLV
jgi:hypothetical protein